MIKQSIRDLVGIGFYSYKYDSYTKRQSKPFFISGKNKRTKPKKK